jgi:hypothetical protein
VACCARRDGEPRGRGQGTDPPTAETPLSLYSLYGITLATAFDFAWPIPRGDGPPDVRFECRGTAPLAVDLDAVPSVLDLRADASQERIGISFHRLEGVDVVRFVDHADHYVWPDRIVCHLHDPSLAWLVEIQLLGMVLALWLELRGTATLHASTAVVAGRAVAFLGTKGGGKTTAATALVAAGHPLLVDDLLALERTGSEVLAQPGYPMLRLWPEQAEHFVAGHAALPLVHPSFTKRRVEVGAGFGSYHASAVPLGRIYLPVRRDGGEVVIEPIPSRHALIATVKNSFLHDAVHGLGLAGSRLGALAEVLQHVPVRRLTYPSGFDRLPELVAAVAADVARG